MVKIGNVIYHNRNWLFPLFYLLLFVPSPEVFTDPVLAMIIGFTVTIIGQIIRVATIGLRYIIRGGKNRRVYAEDLVTDGIFAHCRNPLYVGNILILVGLGIASNSLLFMAVCTPIFLFFWQAIVIAEENFLRTKFGEPYNQYCKDVNRWLINPAGLGSTLSSMKFNWGRVIRREHNSAFYWLLGAVGIVMKHFYVHDNRFSLEKNLTWFMVAFAILIALYVLVRVMKAKGKLTDD
jgi:protein-S-isoprenylcysteine O-methyltransferase Ste14